MTNLYRFVGLLAALLMSASIYAGDIQVENAWVRATAPGQDAAGVDLTVTSKQAASLVGVSSQIAASAELHSMTSENGMMRMREVKVIELPAGKRVNLRARGYHLMLNGLKAPLKEGETVPLTLSIKVGKQGVVKLETKVEVRSLHSTGGTSHEEEHHHNN
jgi:hypothetical protein